MRKSLQLGKKLSLYADDRLLYMSNPTPSLAVVISILDGFGSYSGYKLHIKVKIVGGGIVGLWEGGLGWV